MRGVEHSREDCSVEGKPLCLVQCSASSVVLTLGLPYMQITGMALLLQFAAASREQDELKQLSTKETLHAKWKQASGCRSV